MGKEPLEEYRELDASTQRLVQGVVGCMIWGIIAMVGVLAVWILYTGYMAITGA